MRIVIHLEDVLRSGTDCRYLDFNVWKRKITSDYLARLTMNYDVVSSFQFVDKGRFNLMGFEARGIDPLVLGAVGSSGRCLQHQRFKVYGQITSGYSLRAGDR